MADSAPLASHTRGRPRSDTAERAILEAFQALLLEVGFARLRVEHVARRARVSKATIYRRWSSKEELAAALLLEHALADVYTPDLGETRAELAALALDVVGRLTESTFGAIARQALSEIASNETISAAFRASVTNVRKAQVRHVVTRGVERGDIDPATDPALVADVLLGALYFRFITGPALDASFGARLVDVILKSCSTARGQVAALAGDP